MVRPDDAWRIRRDDRPLEPIGLAYLVGWLLMLGFMWCNAWLVLHAVPEHAGNQHHIVERAEQAARAEGSVVPVAVECTSKSGARHD